MKYKTGVKWVNWFQIMNQGYQPGRGEPIYTFFILCTAWNVFVFSGYSLVRIFPNSGWIREGKDQKTPITDTFYVVLLNWKYQNEVLERLSMRETGRN